MKKGIGRCAALVTMSGVAVAVALGPGVTAAQASERPGGTEVARAWDPANDAAWSPSHEESWDPAGPSALNPAHGPTREADNRWHPDKKKHNIIKKKEKATFERVTWFKKDDHKKWDDPTSADENPSTLVAWDPKDDKWDPKHKKHNIIIKKKEKATFERVTWFKKDDHKKWDDHKK